MLPFDFITCMRPRQWLKNAVVFAPLVFGVAFTDMRAVTASLLAFLLLCVLSSAVYIVNDVVDIEENRRHPTKRNRPIADGRISIPSALFLTLLLLSGGLTLAWYLGTLVFVASLGFLVINSFYTFGGKQIAILDVMLIGTSFVMRVLIGAAAIRIAPSGWLVLTLFFLATYLGFTKRVAELRLSVGEGRPVLRGYTAVFLDHARSATLSVTLALYALYTFNSPFGEVMALTVPFVFFGLMRYQAIVDADHGANDGPSDHVYNDHQLQVAVVLWGLVTLLIIVCTV